MEKQLNLFGTVNEATNTACFLGAVSGSFINYLKTLPENSGQLVDLKHCNGILRCYFMWFYTDEKIDLKPIDNINIITVHKRNFDKILPVF
jgi:hypothetical protein